jgi:integrase
VSCRPETFKQHLRDGPKEGGIAARAGWPDPRLAYLRKTLHAALRRALEPELIARHPMAALRKRLPTGAAPEAKVIGAEAVADLLDSASGTPYHSAILLASACGLRRGEACGLLWRKFDFKAKELTIDQARVSARKGIATGKTKSG